MSEAASESTPADTNATPSIENRIVALRHQVEHLDDAATGTDLVHVPGVDPGSAVELKTAAADQRALANAMRREVAEMERQIRAQAEAQLAEMRALMAPIQQKIAQNNEVIATLNLYLGRDEEIILLADGEPAPASSPLTVRQMVLSMDEETALYSDEGGDAGGMDFRDLTKFDEWLLSNPEHLQQILPEQRGVVALVPRRRGQDYKDPWMNKRGAEENNHTYWLIRNGQKLWRMDTELEVGTNLVPARDEFTGLFRVKKFNHATRQDEWHDLVPGSTEWMQAEKAQGARQRHFFRIALILQGLIDRTKIFYPLPEGGISLLHPESYESGKAVMLADGERALQSSRKPFYEWLKDLNDQLRPGMRFIGAFSHGDFQNDRADDYRGSYNRRITPKGASGPRDLTIHQIDRIEKNKLIFKYDRTDMVWTADGDYRAPKTRASAWVHTSDRFVLPIDLVDSATMTEYLSARTERHAYLDSFALLKRAIAIKDKEAEQEAPFREYLASSVAAELQLDLDAVRAGIGEVIDWWKLGNKWHRPLVKGEGPAAEAKAARMITAEFKARHASATGVDGNNDAKAVQILRALDPSIMFIGRRHSGGYLAFAPQPRKYGKVQGLRGDLWVTEYTLTGVKGKSSKRQWVLVGPRGQKTAPLFQSDAWAAWDTVSTNYREHLTDGDVDDLLEEFARGVAQKVRAEGYREYRNSDLKKDAAAALFAITLTDKGTHFEGWVHSPALVARTAGVETTREANYVRIVAAWEKPARGGVTFKHDYEDWTARESARWAGSSNFDDPTVRPWCCSYGGRQNGSTVLVEYADTYAQYLKFVRDVKRHNDELGRKADLVNMYLWNAEKTAEQQALDAAHARYMEDYNDPEGWEDHRKTIKVEATKIRRGYSSHTTKHPLEVAVRALVNTGAPIEGRTVRDVLEKSGADAEVLGQIETEGLAAIVLTSGKRADR
jgi:hypothetical protein